MKKFCFHCMKPAAESSVCPHCGRDIYDRSSTTPYHLKQGTLLADRYYVGDALGEGGFGITYIGLDKLLVKRVAIKEFYPSGAANRTSMVSDGVIITQGKEEFFNKGVERFLFEAKNVAAFSEEDGIVDVLDYFQANNTAYIVMEYLEGENLRDYVNHHGLFDPKELISLMMPVMKSLKTIHSKGVIHRDISPDNLMLTKSGRLKLMDFGSARYYTNDERQMSIVLKQGYAPEEQYRRNSSQGPYTDVYALCATIYSCITGKVPLDSLDRLANDTLVPPSALGVKISPVHEAALMHGLAVSAKNRCRNMDSLMREFSGNAEAPVTVSADSYPGTSDDKPPQYRQSADSQQQAYQRPVSPQPQPQQYQRPVNPQPQPQQYQRPVNPQPQPQQYQRPVNPQQQPQYGQPVNPQQYQRSVSPQPYQQQPVNPQPPYGYQPPAQKQKSNTPIIAAIIIILVAVLAAGGVLVYFLFSNNNNGGDSSGSSLASSQTVPTFAPKSSGSDDSSEDSQSSQSSQSSSGSSLLTEDERKAALNSIVDKFDEAIPRMDEYKDGGTYEYVECADNRLWIGTKGSFHDDESNKTWYFLDENHKPYFVYKHTSDNEYRYYIYNDEVIKYTVGSDPSDQVHYVQGDSGIDDSVQQIVNDAYAALYTLP